jgi:uncharacterized protein (TIGR02328 family)
MKYNIGDYVTIKACKHGTEIPAGTYKILDYEAGDYLLQFPNNTYWVPSDAIISSTPKPKPIKLIPYLPRQQLLGQWRECIALLGKGWGRNHSTVNYVFKYTESKLVNYTLEIGAEMKKRKYKPNALLISKALMNRHSYIESIRIITDSGFETPYPEHNDAYLHECLSNLAAKGVIINYTSV